MLVPSFGDSANLNILVSYFRHFWYQYIEIDHLTYVDFGGDDSLRILVSKSPPGDSLRKLVPTVKKRHQTIEPIY